MARPLPKDAEHIAANAKKAEVKSVATFAFIGGVAVGFGLGAAVFAGNSGSFYFGLGGLVVALVWYFASGFRISRALKKKK